MINIVNITCAAIKNNVVPYHNYESHSPLSEPGKHILVFGECGTTLLLPLE